MLKDYLYILAPFSGWAAAQLLKPVFHFIMTSRWEAKQLLTSGGMPSSHSSCMCALTAAIGATKGIKVSEFAIALTVSLVVMYDAKGVRRASGTHAAYINTLMEDLKDILDKGFTPERLKTELGHTGNQVIAGMFLGIAVGLLLALPL